jgi:hypothetical protein
MQGNDELKNRKPGETWGVIDFSNPERSDPPISKELQTLIRKLKEMRK